MLDLMSALDSWRPAVSGQRCAVATIVATGGSVPRPLGTSMLVSEYGEVLGSLSGGCVEGAVVEAALQSLRDGGSRREQFGYSAEDAFAVGLTCGGELDVHIQPIGADDGHLNPAMLDRLRNHGATDAVALIRRMDAVRGGAIVVADPARFRASESPELAAILDGDPRLLRSAAPQLESLLRGGRAGLIRLAPVEGCAPGSGPAIEPMTTPEPISLFVESRLPPARMIVFGANDFGAALIPAGKLLGYRVTMCDARPAFAGQGRFTTADEVVMAWPHRYLAAEASEGRLDARTVVCILTHDPKFDVPLLETALGLDLAFVGAMGSRRSHRQRIESLLAGGMAPKALTRLHSPIGLDLGAVTPAEVAVSITAEIISSRSGASLKPLKEGKGPIHRPEPEASPSFQTTQSLQEGPWT
ncbi:XdhC family protein [Arthrobacter sp. ISL-30]|uniref:XdhC family protein n=1 Tax=Arthrobacter sp. ISL-30 TaxID=2819109 RepID=UPI001BEC224D|nr:XdhC/CoxI family protein [Arthrobacter sp. ISL-30]MBT2512495.1 XdhC family protein [Arthrobacter sp. ISL-30]